MTKRSGNHNKTAPARLAVHLTPRGGSDTIEGWADGRLRVRVASPPVDGRANQALIRLLARALGIAPKSVTIVAGTHSRLKRIAVEGRSISEIEQFIDVCLEHP